MEPKADRGGSLAYVYLLTAVAALGGLLFGYDTAVIAGATGFLKARFGLTPFWEGFSAASALLGCALGAGAAGFLSDRFGRKKVLVVAGLAFFISALGTALPQTLAQFIIFRFIGGVGIGAASITSPMYIAEVAPFRIRGRMVSLNQFAIVSGMLIVYFVNYFITNYGLVCDQRTVAEYVAQHGKTLDVAATRDYLRRQIPTWSIAKSNSVSLIRRRRPAAREWRGLLSTTAWRSTSKGFPAAKRPSHRRWCATSSTSTFPGPIAARSTSSSRPIRRSTARPWQASWPSGTSASPPSRWTWPSKACWAGMPSGAGGGCSAPERCRRRCFSSSCSWFPRVRAG